MSLRVQLWIEDDFEHIHQLSSRYCSKLLNTVIHGSVYSSVSHIDRRNRKISKNNCPTVKNRFSQKHHLSSTECSKSDFDFSYLLILSSHIRPLIQTSNFVIRQVYKAISPLSSVYFFSSLIQKLLTGFSRAHLESCNKIEVIDALISYVLVKF